MRIVGLMSGTSMDGVDAVLLDVDADPAEVDALREGGRPGRARIEWAVEAFCELPYAADRRSRLREVVEGRVNGGDEGASRLCSLHRELAVWLGEAVEEVCDRAGRALGEVDLIGSHGHTVWHEPPAEGRQGASLQIGNPAVLAERTGLPVVCDFRSADLAAGGHGAPLVAFTDDLLFAAEGRSRALQNLGGIANVTHLPPRGSDEGVLAFDTGPGNALLDVAAELATGGRLRFDPDGALAERGSVDADLLQRLMDRDFFRREPPRSTGRETFGRALVEALARERDLASPTAVETVDEGWCDLLATLTAFTARSVGDAYRRWIIPRGVDGVVLTGGGARNPTLVRAIREELRPLPLHPSESLGVDPAAREAVAFAVLAWAHVHDVPGNVPGATGARAARVLGSFTPGPGSSLQGDRP